MQGSRRGGGDRKRSELIIAYIDIDIGAAYYIDKGEGRERNR